MPMTRKRPSRVSTCGVLRLWPDWRKSVAVTCTGSGEPTSGLKNRLPLLQLRVITQALQGFARACKSRISKPVSILWLAARCTVLRSRWYQSGVNIVLEPAQH
jgi:hypothetical protein